jgi:putative tricarboxylic transport membrane protein
MDALRYLFDGFGTALQPHFLIYCFIGSLVGTVVGLLPGLGPAAALSILIPFATGLDPTAAIIMLVAVYYGAMYGGSTTSILLNIPGEAASVATCLDGYQMARKGRAGAALGISAISSFFAGTVSIFGLVFLAPLLVQVAFRFGPIENFCLLIFSLSIVVTLAGPSLVKGAAATLLGLGLAAVGIDPQTGSARLTFGSVDLMAGFDIVVVVMGLFAVSEVVANLAKPSGKIISTSVRDLLPGKKDIQESSGAIVRGTVVGFLLGLIPGVAPAVSSFVSYAVEKRVCKRSEEFGTGRIEGVAGPEGANNASSSASLIPLFTLGLPTSATLSVLLGALMIYGIQPGPLMFQDHKDLVWTVIASMYLGNVMLLILNLPLIPIWVQLLRIPYVLMGPAILVICSLAAYGVRNSMFDVYLMLIFGGLGYAMRELQFPIVPLIIAMILGDKLESALRQSLILTDGSFLAIARHPIGLVFLVMAVLSVALSIMGRIKGRIPESILADES